jgi:hypothetical protein
LDFLTWFLSEHVHYWYLEKLLVFVGWFYYPATLCEVFIYAKMLLNIFINSLIN